MINNLNEEQKQETYLVEKNPDEAAGMYLQSFLKILDPVTGEIITQGRN